MNLIYHYCLLETFTQIIKNKTIRLSDINKTNDYLEKRWGMSLLQEALIKELENNKMQLNLTNDYWNSDYAQNHIEKMSNHINKYISHQTLISCFSLGQDQLGQWRAYGQDGEGISIGFDYSLIKKLLKNQDKLLVNRIIYKKDNQEKFIREKMFIPALKYMTEKFKTDNDKGQGDFHEYFIEQFDCFCEVLDKSTEQVFTFVKNPAFEEEKEVRIVYNTGVHEQIERKELRDIMQKEIRIGNKRELVLNPIQYQAKGKKLVAYADLSFANCIGLGIIKEIIIGPKSKVTINDIQQFLLANGFDYDVDVRMSGASYC